MLSENMTAYYQAYHFLLLSYSLFSPLHDTSKTDIITINPAAILLIVIPLKVTTSIVSLINYRYYVKRKQPNRTLLIMVLEHEALKELLTVTMASCNNFGIFCNICMAYSVIYVTFVSGSFGTFGNIWHILHLTI